MELRLKRIASVALLAVSLTARAQTPLGVLIDRVIAAPPFDRAIWGIVVEDDDGTQLYARNAQTLLMPASNRKLFASSVIVSCLHPDGQFATGLWLDKDGEAVDVILEGGGDPSFGGRYYDVAPRAFEPFVHALRSRGIGRVRDVIADVSLFDRETVPGSWKVGNLPYGYAAPVDSLTYAENVAGDDVAAVEPGLFAADALREALRFAGIRVEGALRLNVTPHAWRERLASVPSPFVEQMLSTVLENSHNLYTEVLFKDLSANQRLPMAATPRAPANPIGSYDASLALERRFLLDEVGLDGADFRFVDGCGLSSDDLVTPAAVVKMLRWMNHPARRALFVPIMASAGSEGTLHHRLAQLGRRLHGKTGTIAGVNALSGFIEMPGNRYRYFSILLNHHLADSSEATGAIDAIVNAVGRTEQ